MIRVEIPGRTGTTGNYRRCNYLTDRVIQRLARPHPGTLLGSGKFAEIADLVKFHDCDGIIFDLELTPRAAQQIGKHARSSSVRSYGVDLNHFWSTRTHEREGHLQVELAQIEYDLPGSRDNGHIYHVRKASVQQRGEVRNRSRLTGGSFVAKRSTPGRNRTCAYTSTAIPFTT